MCQKAVVPNLVVSRRTLRAGDPEQFARHEWHRQFGAQAGNEHQCFETGRRPDRTSPAAAACAGGARLEAE